MAGSDGRQRSDARRGRAACAVGSYARRSFGGIHPMAAEAAAGRGDTCQSEQPYRHLVTCGGPRARATPPNSPGVRARAGGDPLRQRHANWRHGVAACHANPDADANTDPLSCYDLADHPQSESALPSDQRPGRGECAHASGRLGGRRHLHGLLPLAAPDRTLGRRHVAHRLQPGHDQPAGRGGAVATRCLGGRERTGDLCASERAHADRALERHAVEHRPQSEPERQRQQPRKRGGPCPQRRVGRGNYRSSTGTSCCVHLSLIERWDGTAWHLVATPALPSDAARSGTLSGVVALSPTDAWAVGEYSARNLDRRALIEHWNGTAWQVVSIPDACASSMSYPRTTLLSVTAAGARDVRAVGSFGGCSRTNGYDQVLIEQWDGTAWHRIASPALNGALVSSLDAVTTDGAGNFWAVGSYRPTAGNDSFAQTLIEHSP